MSTDVILALLKEIWSSLERFLFAFIGWYSASQAKDQETIIKASQARLKAFEVKERVNKDVKELSNDSLNKSTVIDE